MRYLVALTLLLASGICAAQLTASFHLGKEVYAPGEPVVLYFTVKNQGSEAQNIVQADPYSFCSGYQIRLSSDPRPGDACSPVGFAPSCLSSSAKIRPGETLTEQILLNFNHDISGPGDYDVLADRHLSYADAVEPFFNAVKQVLEVSNQLHFRVDDSASVNASLWGELKKQLQSRDPQIRREAARTLASAAPREAENTLLTFTDNKEFLEFAPMALARLNTPRSLSALGDLLVKSQSGTAVNLDALRYIAATGDHKWYPLLAELAKRNPQIFNYVSAAAKVGGDESIPILLELLQSKDREYTYLNAISALGDTGSAQAVPILLGLLRDSHPGVAIRALTGLRTLTHKTSSLAHWADDPQGQFPRWASWWASVQPAPKIYKPDECGEFSLLP